MLKSNPNRAFTLAEVLVTLAVIGVVASLTIPTLISNIGDEQNKIAWKKSFAEFSQATMMLANDNGGSLKGLCADGDHTCLKNKILKYFNYTKSCNSGEFWELLASYSKILKWDNWYLGRWCWCHIEFRCVC